jgi:succinate dehydrogenase/fumarate reductase-like Fe-S protein
MAGKTITVKVFRFDPLVDEEPHYQNYEIPFVQGMSAMDALDHIYQNIDGTLAYYDHAGCSLGICARCTGKINGKAGLFCQALVTEDVCLEPMSTSKVIKDLVIERKKKSE